MLFMFYRCKRSVFITIVVRYTVNVREIATRTPQPRVSPVRQSEVTDDVSTTWKWTEQSRALRGHHPDSLQRLARRITPCQTRKNVNNPIAKQEGNHTNQTAGYPGPVDLTRRLAMSSIRGLVLSRSTQLPIDGLRDVGLERNQPSLLNLLTYRAYPISLLRLYE